MQTVTLFFNNLCFSLLDLQDWMWTVDENLTECSKVEEEKRTHKYAIKLLQWFFFFFLAIGLKGWSSADPTLNLFFKDWFYQPQSIFQAEGNCMCVVVLIEAILSA